MIDGRLYTRVEVCELLGISMYSLMKFTRGGVIPHIRKGQKVLYEKEVINKIMSDKYEKKGTD